MAKLAAIVLLLAMAAPDAITRLGEIDGWGLKLAYLGLSGSVWAAILILAYIPRFLVRLIGACVLAAGTYFVDVFERVTLQFMTYDAFLTMIDSSASLQEAMAQNSAAFLAGLLQAGLLLVAIMLPPRKIARFEHPVLATVPLAVLALLSSLLYARGGEGARGLQQGYTALSYSTLATIEKATESSGPRRPPLITPAREPLAKTVVLIMDESIGAAYLDINSPAGVETGLDGVWAGAKVHNFGVAASVSGCSIGSNIAIRFGGTRDNYLRMIAEYPSLWAYARQAGMKTVYIDAVLTGGRYALGMKEGERAEIDELIQFDDVPVVDRDQAAARELVRQLADPEPKFIFVNKVGAHFPVSDKFPDDYLTHQPAMPRGNFADITDTGERFGFSGTPDAWRRYRNSYRNTLSWNVGKFFETLLNEGDLSDAVILYTSDHGQTLHEEGQPGTSTHCNPEPIMEEGAVPMLVIEGSGATDDQAIDWGFWASENHDRTSHFMLAPTALHLMGYDPAAISRIYGDPLIVPSRDPMTFATRFNVRFNKSPGWKPIEPAKLAQPPASDARMAE